MNKEKALKNQGLEFREDIQVYRGLCTVALAQDSGTFLYGKRQH